MSMYNFENIMFSNPEPVWAKRERLDYCEPFEKYSFSDGTKSNRMSIIQSVLSMFF